MRTRKTSLLFIIIALLQSNGAKCSETSSPDLTIASIISSGMVVQQQSEFHIWGSGVDGVVARVNPDWGEEKSTVVSGGVWSIIISIPEASFEPHQIDIYKEVGDNSSQLVKSIEDILFGEVWLAVGQSNMKMTMAEAAYHEIISQTEDDALRYFKITESLADEPQSTCGGQWYSTTSEKTGGFGAVSWFFAQALKNKLNVPVGIINASYGDSPIEAWTSSSVFSENERLNQYYVADNDTELAHRKPSVLFNGMLNPLIPYSINGCIWYQGESSYNDISYYAEMQSAMVEDWRNRWGDDELPFYYVQIAPYLLVGGGNGGPSPNLVQYAMFREEQEKALGLIDHSGMVVVSDIGDYYDIHPKEKQKVGMRLANFALAETYGEAIENYKSALFESLAIEENHAIISFQEGTCGTGFEAVSEDSYVPGLWIAGSDKVFFRGRATIDEDRLIVASDSVEIPVSVRYDFYNCINAELRSMEGLPIAPFRTDNWDVSEVKFIEFSLYDLISDYDQQNVSPNNMWGNIGYKLHENPNFTEANNSNNVVEIVSTDFGYEGFSYKTHAFMDGKMIDQLKLKVFAEDADAFNSLLVKFEDSKGIEPSQSFELNGLYQNSGVWDSVSVPITIIGNAFFDIITIMPNIWATDVTKFYLDDIELTEKAGVNIQEGVLNDLLIYPNPFDDYLFLRGDNFQNVSWRLYSLTGVLQRVGIISEEQEIQLSDLVPGVYFLNINEEIYKLVKN